MITTVYDLAKMGFSQALTILKSGGKTARTGWNGKNMWLCLVKHAAITGNREPGYTIAGGAPDISGLQLLPWIGMKTADDGFVPWLASQTDILAEDWVIVATNG